MSKSFRADGMEINTIYLSTNAMYQLWSIFLLHYCATSSLHIQCYHNSVYTDHGIKKEDAHWHVWGIQCIQKECLDLSLEGLGWKTQCVSSWCWTV